MKRVHIIACAVLKTDLDVLAASAWDEGLELTMHFLPGGLHNRPDELREQLQEAIDDASHAAPIDLIAVGYGLCGMGTVGIHARDIPLAVPRVHDCIALFLGSDQAYSREFGKYPGTYYVSAGWVQGRQQPQSGVSDGPSDSEFARFVDEYGRENATAIERFLTSWQRNYQRAAYIDTGDGEETRYAVMAQQMAEAFGWKYERIKGDRSLLSALAAAQDSNDAILIVPPHCMTAFDPAGRKLTAVSSSHTPSGPTTRTFAVPVSREDASPAATAATSGEVRLGLGIDAGGTYTDVVVFDFAEDKVLEKAKALTTKWDFSEGISNALNRLSPEHLARVGLVSVSTTLATNAIVEGRGQRVGLLVMPPCGWTDLPGFKHEPSAIIRGQLQIDGTEVAPIDPEQVRTIVGEMLAKDNVKAFAVAGYASHANPSHELQVRHIIGELCDLPVTCGHDVSEGLNYRIRAETAALNARIIPCLEALFDRVKESLVRFGVKAPIAVVKSDGSLTSIEAAHEKPVETILSGPAASVAGAQHLTAHANAMVVDMGGTTSDTAVIENGIVETCAEGAIVGGWETHVRALAMRTIGLGGDSVVRWNRGRLSVGPQRVAPVSWLVNRQPEAIKALEWIEAYVTPDQATSQCLELVSLNERNAEHAFEGHDARVVDALRKGPCSVVELAQRTGRVAWQLVSLQHLEETHVIQRCGLTPTDMLHTTGAVELWDAEAARRLCRIYSRLCGIEPDAFATHIIGEVERLLALELLQKHLDRIVDRGEIDDSPMASELVDTALRGGREGLRVEISLEKPIVGIGAPVHLFLPKAAERLHAPWIIPPHADVANAIGAITGSVFIRRKVTITADETARYHVKGVPDAPVFDTLENAETFAVEQLKAMVSRVAQKAGTNKSEIEIVIDDQVGAVSDGSGLFLGRTLEARLVAKPDLDALQTFSGSPPSRHSTPSV